MAFRFKEFRVYQEAKDYCKFCHDVINGYFDATLNLEIEECADDLVRQLAAFRNTLKKA